MKTLLFSAAAAAFLLPAAAMAQDDAGSSTRRIEPYVGVMGGVHNYDSETSKEGIPPVGYKGRMVEGVAGVNVNVAGPLVLGVEGTASKGVSGDIDWEYGAAGRVGVKAGKDSMIFTKVGYQWTNFDALGPDSRDYHGMTYGAGVELSPADMGGSAQSSNVRLRVQADTTGNFHSIRPMAGVVAKF
ncbi:outer membrane protein [Sphingobium sp. HWE2-09]|jgi:outer membrane immunogenic protein|uniref:outer membrane protein n=1 Tax=Sphingobium sp. HWE2-09 TaxID=3108390 RepID=UPI002DCCDA18|nr:outer membrane beta-barrel protein [Sphingobium sp. HWE2-09]